MKRPGMTEIMREAPYLRGVLRRCGIPARDREDVLAEVFLGAWLAIEEGRYQPKAGLRPQDALRRWLVGIAWRQASHYRDRAHVRREVLFEPSDLEATSAGDLEGKLAARSDLAHVRDLPPAVLAVAELAAIGASMVDLAHDLGIPVSTAYKRLYRAQHALTVETSRQWRRVRRRS